MMKNVDQRVSSVFEEKIKIKAHPLFKTAWKSPSALSGKEKLFSQGVGFLA